MDIIHETIKIPDKFLAWIYLHSENDIVKVEKHWHRSLEITMILSQKIQYEINGHYFVANAGDLVLVNSGDIHSCFVDESNPGDAISIIFPFELLKQSCSTIEDITFHLNPANSGFGQLIDKFNQLYNVYKNRSSDPYYQLRINSAVYEMLHILLTEFQTSKMVASSIKTQKYYNRCSDIINYIETNYHENITLESVSNYYGLSKEHFSRTFRQCMGTTFKKYVSSIRMHHAYQALIESDYSITQIALDNGFSDSRAFASCFRAVYRETPQKYRKYLRENSSYHKKIPF